MNEEILKAIAGSEKAMREILSFIQGKRIPTVERKNDMEKQEQEEREQHERKQHEDNRQKYHTILSRSYLYTGKIPEYHRQIHPRHPHLHRLAADTGTERHHQKNT